MIPKTGRWHRQFARFSLIGAMNATIDLGGFNLLVAIFHLYTGPLVGLFSMFTASAAMVNSYLMNRTFTFEVKSGHKIEHINRFVISSIIGIVINSTMVAAASFLIPHLPFSPHLILSAGKIVGMGSEGLWNFIIYRHWVFN